MEFQSTRPVWGATHRRAVAVLRLDISIHAPRMGRDSALRASSVAMSVFQSTRPVWGATPTGGGFGALQRFQSTRPVWGATAPVASHRRVSGISIHAPRMGRDSKTAQFSCAVLRKSNNKYNAADNLQAKYACGIVQTTRAYPNFRCEAPGKSLSACASHSDHQHALRLIAGP